MSIGKYQIFLKTVELGSFTAAARALKKHVKEPIRKEALNMGLNILLAGLAVLLVVVGIVSKVTDK